MAKNDTVKKTVTVAFALCVVCSILVSAAAVKLKPIQEVNKQLDIKKKLLLTCGVLTNPKAGRAEVEEAFKMVETKIVDLESGKFTDDIDPVTFDQKKAAKDSKLNKMIEPSKDLGKIKRRSKYAKVYLIRRGGQLDQVVLPINGKGLWSTLYGFLSLETDFKTVRGLGYYDHGETPGLGGEVDNARWRALWNGKVVMDEEMHPIIRVVKGAVIPENPDAKSQVDGLSGATITSNGVEGMLRYWLGRDGFGPFLENMKMGGL